jgi:uncharacterized protein (DUF342 family)
MNKINEAVLVEISEDEYQAFLTIYDASDLNLSTTLLNRILKMNGVIIGSDIKVLTTIVEIYNREGKLPSKVQVAKGVVPFAGQAPVIDLKFEFSSTPTEDESGKINYREISNILNVKKDQLLAIKKKIKQAVNGITVTGKRTTFKKLHDLTLIAGENVIKDEQESSIFYRAKVHGTLKYNNDTLSVFPTLEIEEDVDFNTGNIHFQGDVKIHRDVLPDFIVESAGNILIWGSAIASTIKADGDIRINAGIVGKNKGEVIAGGYISATFAENTKLIAGGDIVIKNGIIGTYVKTDRYLTIETRRSRIVGCCARADKGITCFNAGSRYDSNTELITGINAQGEKDYKKIEQTYKQYIEDAKKIEIKYGASNLKQKTIPRNLMENCRNDIMNWDFLKKKIQKTHKALREAELKMYDYSATIRIRETLYPRVVLKIGKFKIKTSKEYFNTTVRYSEEEGRIVLS